MYPFYLYPRSLSEINNFITTTRTQNMLKNLLLLLILTLLIPSFLIGQSDFIEKLSHKLEHQDHDSHGHSVSKYEHIHVNEIKIKNGAVMAYIELDEESIALFDESDFEHFIMPLSNYSYENGYSDFNILYRKEGTDEEYQNIFQLIIENDTPPAIYEKPRNDDPFPDIEGNIESIKAQRFGSGLHFGQVQPTGALSGKTIWLSPGHGYHSISASTYSTQRGNTNSMVEDFGSVEIVANHLLKYLWNAGANVWLVRERDFNTNEVIVDNDAGAPSYTETGTWSSSASSGYNGGGYRYANSSGSETETAIFTPTIPEAGWYWVSVYFREGANRCVDTKYKITHAGGTTEVSVNQEYHGQTWNYIGQFYFDAGTSSNVTISNSSSDVGQAIIADAVRFGGGMGSIEDCDDPGIGTSGQARFEEAAQLYAPYMGYPNGGCTSDVTIRPNYAEWELSKGPASEQNNPGTNTYNSIYVSWHSNAATGTARGTVSYIYHNSNVYGDSGSPTNCDAGTASGYLRNYLQEEIMEDIHANWDATWNDRGVNCANFGEVRQLTTMPGTLLEMGFHDNADDAEAITTPAFREVEARGVYHGIVDFFNHYDGSVPTTLLPEPPTHLVAKNSAAGEITLTWNAPPTGTSLGDAASGYRVYMSTHGKGFNDAVEVVGTTHTFTGLNPNTIYYFRVSGTNIGGESFPTSVVAAKTPASGFAVPILIVDGFDRLQRSQMLDLDEGGSLGVLKRGFLERMNSYTYMVEHAQSISSCGGSFDGATNEAVISGSANLTDYNLVDWFLGEESTTDRTFDATEQTKVQTFLDGGGDIIVSGSEIGWDIGRAASANAALPFYNNYLKSVYAGDGAGTYDFVGSTGEIFDGSSGDFDDGTSIYDVNFPDRLAASAGAVVALDYSGGTGDGAAVIYDDPAGFGVVNFGFPLETVNDPTVRNELICNSIMFLNSVILPVEGLELKGTMDKNANILTWTTITEKNTDVCVLERSADGFSYEKINSTPAAGESLSPREYGYADEEPFPKTYYRVKLYDYDGSFTYSNVIVLSRFSGLNVNVFPNPSKGGELNIRIDTELNENMNFRLLDMSGKELFFTILESKENLVQLPVLSPGVYQYMIEMNGEIARGKWIKI